MTSQRTALVCLGLALCNVLGAAAQAQDVSFIARRDFNVPGNVTFVAVGDHQRSGSPYLAVFFVDAKIGTIVGGGRLQPSLIFRTTDGGDTWRRQAIGIGSTFFAVAFVDADTGTTVGRGGTILHTNTGGD
jgi:hypothetical protein